MKYKVWFLIVSIAICSKCPVSASNCTDKKMLLDYMRTRAVQSGEDSKKPVADEMGAVVSLKKAKNYVLRRKACTSKKKDDVYADIIDVTNKDGVTSLCSDDCDILMGEAFLFPNSQPHRILLCVFDHKIIYELTNEGGFQRLAVQRWLDTNNKIPVVTKLKIIARALAGSNGGSVVGYISEGKDFKKVFDFCKEAGKSEDIAVTDEHKKWFDKEEDYYIYHHTILENGYVYYVVWTPFLSLRRVGLSALGNLITEIEDRHNPGQWIPYPYLVGAEKGLVNRGVTH